MKQLKTWPYFLQSSMELGKNHGFESLSHGSVFNSSSNLKFNHIYTLTIVIHKSRNLIGSEEIAQFGPK